VDPVLWFVTPVWRRFYLTKNCLEQRARLLERLPFEAHQVVVGDDENLEIARGLGFDTVEMDNQYVGRKFNAGYRHAVAAGATHCMPIGSDSWLHESIFEEAQWSARRAVGIVGLSSFSPDGLERVDMAIKYPAGFGVGMVYPAHAVAATSLRGEASDPKKNRGIDNSTWARVGKGKVQIRFLPAQHHRYINFHSVDESITDFRLLKASKNRVRIHDAADPFACLDSLYDADLIEGLKRMYALRALEVFCTGVKPTFVPRFGRLGRQYPNIKARGGTVPPRDRDPARYPNIALRGRGAKPPVDYDKIEERLERVRRGIPLSRDEEISLRFDMARGF
jgi:hypothetical protein